MIRLEWLLVAVCSAVWLAALAIALGFLPRLRGVEPDLYQLYSLAAVLGWTAGNVYLMRRGTAPSRFGRRQLLWVYLFQPPGWVYFLWTLVPPADQARAPLVPLYAYAVYAIFFLVPISFRRKPERPPDSRS